MKNHPCYFLKTVFFLLLVLVATVQFSGLAVAVPAGKFTGVKGNVDIIQAGKDARQAELGNEVHIGDIIWTKSGSNAEITMVDENIIRLFPASRLEISEYLVEKKKKKEVINLFHGSVQSLVKKTRRKFFGKKRKDIYEVHTPTAVIGARGTDFTTFHKNSISGSAFDKGKGYCYNKNLPEIVKDIKAGQGMLVWDPFRPPMILPVTDPLFQQFMSDSGLTGSAAYYFEKLGLMKGETKERLKSCKGAQKTPFRTQQPFYANDEWGRPSVWVDNDGDGFLDTVRVYGYDGKPRSEVQWYSVTDLQIRARLYHPDGGYTEYIDTNNNGTMNKKITVDARGNRREEAIEVQVSVNPDYQNYDIYSNFDKNGTPLTWEHYDKDGRLRQREIFGENYQPRSQETWDADGNRAEPDSWNPVEDWRRRAGEEFRRATGIDGSPSPYGGGGADYSWTTGSDGIPKPTGLSGRKAAFSLPGDCNGAAFSLTGGGEAVSKGSLSITDPLGNSTESVLLEIPDDSAPQDKSIEVVKKDQPINPKSDYIVEAKGYDAKKVKGSDLIQKGGVQLEKTPKRYTVISPGKNNPEDAAKETAKAIYILTGEADKDMSRIADMMLDYHLSLFNKAGIDPATTGKEGIESVVPYLQPIFIFNTGSKPTEKERDKNVPYISVESLFGARFEPKAGEDKIVTEPVPNLSAAIGPSLRFEHAQLDAVFGGLVIGSKDTSFFSRLDLKVDWNGTDKVIKRNKISKAPDLSGKVIADDPGVDDFVVPDFYLPYLGCSSCPPITIVVIDDRRGIQKSETFPDDPLFLKKGSWGQRYFDQWGLRHIGFKPGTKAKSLWPEKGEPVVVAVIDTGIDRFHPELQGAVWTNKKEIPGNGIDDDRNGHIDDVHGWNFVDNNNDIRDINGHGTATAGIIASLVNNGRGIAGVNPWAKIMPIKAMEWNGRGWAFDISKAIFYAVNNGARVINISLGGKRLNRMELLAVHYARSKGAVVVAAAGNEGVNTQNFSPAGLPGVITVAATGPDKRRVSYSGWGINVDIAAPGVDILSLRARKTDLLKFEKKKYKPGSAFVSKDKDYYRIEGTSFAAPFVSGVASLILSKNPGLRGKQVTRMVLHSAKDIDTPGWDQFTGYGLLDARAALEADPEFYVISRILKVGGAKEGGKFFIEVSGRAKADKFSRAWIEIGQGDKPKQWKKVSDDITAQVNRGRIALIPTHHFRGAKVWMLRLIVEHKNGFRRESRFKLKLG